MYEVVPDTLSYTVAQSIYDLCPEATKRTPSRIINIEVRAWIREVYRCSFWFGTNQPMPLLDRLTGDRVGAETCVRHVTDKTGVDPYGTETHSFRSKERSLEVNSVRKLFPTVFWDAKGVLVDFLPRGETLEALPYCNAVSRVTGDVQRGLERSMLVSPFSLSHIPDVLQHERRDSTWYTRHLRSSSLVVPSIGPCLANDWWRTWRVGDQKAKMHVCVLSLRSLMRFWRWDKCVKRWGDYVLNTSVRGVCMCVYVNEICS